jgi:outer membrane protein assembly factor BamB
VSTPSRRGLLASLATAGSATLAGCSNPFGRTDCTVGDRLAGDWSQAGGGPAHAGRGVGPGADSNRIAWRVGLGEDRVVGSLAYADGTLYATGSRIADRERVGSLTALDAATGATEWTAASPGAPNGTPAVTDDRILLASRPTDPDAGFLVAYDHDGEAVWRESFDTRLTVAPTVHDGTVYLGLWDGTVRAYDPTDGTERWRVRFADERQPGSIFLRGENPAVYGGRESDNSSTNHVLTLIRIFK